MDGLEQIESEQVEKECRAGKAEYDNKQVPEPEPGIYGTATGFNARIRFAVHFFSC